MLHKNTMSNYELNSQYNLIFKSFIFKCFIKAGGADPFCLTFIITVSLKFDKITNPNR